MNYIAQLEAVLTQKLDPIVIYVSSVVLNKETDRERAEQIVDAILYLYHVTDSSLDAVTNYVFNEVEGNKPIDKEKLLFKYEG